MLYEISEPDNGLKVGSICIVNNSLDMEGFWKVTELLKRTHTEFRTPTNSLATIKKIMTRSGKSVINGYESELDVSWLSSATQESIDSIFDTAKYDTQLIWEEAYQKVWNIRQAMSLLDRTRKPKSKKNKS